MKKSQIKIGLFESNGSFVDYIDSNIIQNINSIEYSGNLGSGQGAIDLNLLKNYNDLTYKENQLIEISFYNEDNKNGFVKYIGFIKNINRIYSKDSGESIELQLLGLGSLLGQYSGTFISNKALTLCLDDFINEFHSLYNISNEMEFIGNSIFKNLVIDNTIININITGTYFDILKGIIKEANKTFYIKEDGSIVLGDQSVKKHILILNNNITDLILSGIRETKITLSGDHYYISPGDKIIIENIDINFNKDNEIIEKVEYTQDYTILYLGKIFSLGELII